MASSRENGQDDRPSHSYNAPQEELETHLVDLGEMAVFTISSDCEFKRLDEDTERELRHDVDEAELKNIEYQSFNAKNPDRTLGVVRESDTDDSASSARQGHSGGNTRKVAFQVKGHSEIHGRKRLYPPVGGEEGHSDIETDLDRGESWSGIDADSEGSTSTIRPSGASKPAAVKHKSPTAQDTPAAAKGSGTPTSSRKSSSGAHSKIGSLDYAQHKPGGGNVNIVNDTKKFDNVQSKLGSKDNADHRPAGGDKKIFSQKVEFKNVKSRCGSMSNAGHKPLGGDKKIYTQKVEWKAESKIGSLDNTTHKAGGGAKMVYGNCFDEIETQKLEFKEKASSKVGSKDNIKHKATGGEKKIETHKLDFKEKATARTKHGGGSNSPHQGTSEQGSVHE